jgi:ubiquinone/menaquinone biosynthesis C-methylase UbiE
VTLSRKTYRWYYDRIGSRYYDLLMKWCFLPLGGESKCRDDLIAHVEFSPQEKILDMCCGTGGTTFAIARKAPPDCKIIGMDLSSGQIRVAESKRQFSNVEFTEGDVSQTTFQDGFFDKVFIAFALHEMPRCARLQVLSEARRVVKSGGRLIILEMDNPKSLSVRLLAGFWLFYWLPFNFETPTRKDMLKHGVCNELAEAGFQNLKRIRKSRGILQVVEGEK